MEHVEAEALWMDDFGSSNQHQEMLLRTLERLLAIDTVDRQRALTQMSSLLAEAFGAEKVDIMLYEARIDSLVALGTSETPMGRRELELGMDRLPLANDGREVAVYRTGTPHITGHADQDPKELQGLTEGLGIRSSMVVPLDIAGERRGILLASSATPDLFTRAQFALFEAAAHWVGVVIHRAELTEQMRATEREQGRRAAADELVTVVAHDLRNYLTPLKARIDLLRRRATRRKHSRDLEDTQVASREIERLSRLVANLLDVSRIEQGLFTLDLQPIDLVLLAQETAQGLSTPRNTIDVRAPETIEEIIITADADRIRQALENLLANAQRYSPPRVPVTLTIDVRHTAEQPGAENGVDVGEGTRDQEGASVAHPAAQRESWAVVTIADQGPGIPPEMLPRLFTRFAAGTDSPGLGVGLYIASEVARAHGGSLTVTSTPGHGTRFALALPIDGPSLGTT